MSRVRPRLTYANVMATVAVFLALGGISYAALKLPKNSVGTKQLKKNAVTGPKVKADALTGGDIKETTLGTVPSATDSQTVGGLTASRLMDASKLHCPSGLIQMAGVCFEAVEKEYGQYFEALEICENKGMRLPLIGELIAFEKEHPSDPGPEEEWVEGLTYYGGETGFVGLIVKASPTLVVIAEAYTVGEPFRCVVPASN